MIYTRKKSSEQPLLPAHLPRIRVEHDLTEAEKTCACGHALNYIGETKTEKLEIIPARCQVIEHVCKKYICKHCNALAEQQSELGCVIKTAKKLLSIIPKSIATPSLLASIAINKFCDHLPLYRQEAIFQRYGIELNRQTMSRWMMQVSEAVVPLINLLTDTILHYDVAFADETVLQVLREDKKPATSTSYMWVFLGGPPDKPILIYQYQPSRSGQCVLDFFEGYQGALHCDGYTGYNKLLATPNIIGINCFAHVRRKFIELLPKGKLKGVAGHVILYLRELYAVEKHLKMNKASVDSIYQTRQHKAVPVLEKLKGLLDEVTPRVPPQSALGKAIAYTLKRWPYLINYLKDGRYEIDNNRSERAIKPFVIGRKNWLFSNTPRGAHASARLFTLIETAKANQLEPFAYLQYIFKELPLCKTIANFEALLPYHLDKNLFNSSHCPNLANLIEH